jgi:hypothetical protein
VCCPLISGTCGVIFEVNPLGRPTRVFLLCVYCVALHSVPAYPLTLHSIEDVADSGRVLVLDDDSVWGVENVDAVDSSLWVDGDDVEVVRNNENPSYPYLLINKDENETVHAKYMGKP